MPLSLSLNYCHTEAPLPFVPLLTSRRACDVGLVERAPRACEPVRAAPARSRPPLNPRTQPQRVRAAPPGVASSPQVLLQIIISLSKATHVAPCYRPLTPSSSLVSLGGDFFGSLGIYLRVRSIAQAASSSHPSPLVCDVPAISYLVSDDPLFAVAWCYPWLNAHLAGVARNPPRQCRPLPLPRY